MKEEILNKLSQEQIFQYYFPYHINIGKYYTNPLRPEDRNPGAFFVYLEGVLFFADFANNPTHMDCFKYIEKLYDISFPEVLKKISIDFNLKLHKPETLEEALSIANSKPTNILYKKPSGLDSSLNKNPRKNSVIKVVNRPFNANDIDYWYQFGITLGTLQHFNIRACEEAWIDGLLYHTYKDNDPMYRYREKDKFKIYRPFANKRYKWRTNYSGGILEGWDQLPESGEMVFITKSKKDVMTLYEIGYPAVAVKAESCIVSENAAELLSNRFKDIYSWFDNDDAGEKYSTIQSKKYSWGKLTIPEGFPKDPSDFVKKYSTKELKNLITNILKK